MAMIPHAEHLARWERDRENRDPRPNTLPMRAPAGMLGAWNKRRCADCGREPCRDCRLDRELSRIHRGLP